MQGTMDASLFLDKEIETSLLSKIQLLPQTEQNQFSALSISLINTSLVQIS